MRNTIDLIATLDEIGDRFMRVCSEAGLNIDVEEGNAFAKAVKTIRGLRGNWESTLGPFVNPATAAAAAVGPVLGAGVPPPAGVGEVELGQFGLDLMDNRWFTDIFTPFDF